MTCPRSYSCQEYESGFGPGSVQHKNFPLGPFPDLFAGDPGPWEVMISFQSSSLGVKEVL